MILAQLYALLAPAVAQVGILPLRHLSQAFTADGSLNISVFTPERSQVTLAAPALHLGCDTAQNLVINRARDQLKLLAAGTWKWYNAMADLEDPTIGKAARETHAYWFGDIRRSDLPNVYQDYNRIFIEQVYKNAINGQNVSV